MHWIDPVTKDSQYNSILKDISNWLKKIVLENLTSEVVNYKKCCYSIGVLMRY